jgi:nitrous oxide reductase accessory protein NosL
MLISERAHAAAIRQSNGSDQLFDDIGCLVAHAQQHPTGDAQYWFHDAVDGRWIVGTTPAFVKAPSIRTPMGGGIVAYRDADAAHRFAASHDGRVVSDVKTLLTSASGAR